MSRSDSGAWVRGNRFCSDPNVPGFPSNTWPVEPARAQPPRLPPFVIVAGIATVARG